MHEFSKSIVTFIHIQFRLVISPTHEGQAETLTTRYAIRLAFVLCRLLSVIRRRRYFDRNLRSGGARNVVLTKQGTRTCNGTTLYIFMTYVDSHDNCCEFKISGYGSGNRVLQYVEKSVKIVTKLFKMTR